MSPVVIAMIVVSVLSLAVGVFIVIGLMAKPEHPHHKHKRRHH